MSITEEFFRWKMEAVAGAFSGEKREPEPLPDPVVLACPFCGGLPDAGLDHLQDGNASRPIGKVQCRNCGAKVHADADTEAEMIEVAAEKWNTRV